MFDEVKENLAFIGEIKDFFWTIIGLGKAIIYLPKTISTMIVGVIHSIFPGDPKIDSRLAMIIALICLYFWYSKWDKVRKIVFDGLAYVPFVGKWIKWGAYYLHYILWGALWGMAGSGWIAAAILLGITLAVNSMSTLKKIKEILGKTFNKGASLASDAGDVIKKGAKLIPTVNLTDPVNKAFEDQLKGMHRQCIDRATNTLKNEEFIAMAEAFKALVLQKYADREGDLSQILEKFQEKHGIRVVELTPLAKVVLLELGEKITD
jgi:hypothetical protein